MSASFKTKEEWLNYLESTHPADIEMGLARVTKVAENLGLFKPAATTIIVGGTNGKGTTTALLGQLLAEKGLTSACYNSPHIHQYNERINCRSADGSSRLSSDEELCGAFRAIEKGRGDVPLTYFEFGTLAAIWQIKQWNVDVAILEVGLGGRLDAVNIVAADLSIVTSVGLDHQDWLGDTLDLIGYEKAGIGRKNKPLICGQPNVADGFIKTANRLHAKTLYQGKDFSITPNNNNSGWHLSLPISAANKSEIIELPKGHIPYFNIASAITGLDAIGLLPELAGIQRAVNNTKVAGRLTFYPCLYQGRRVTFILDVAHNPQAAEFLATQLIDCDSAVLAMLADKDPVSVVQSLPRIKRWSLATLTGYRGQASENILQKLTPLPSDKEFNCFSSVKSAMVDSLKEITSNERNEKRNDELQILVIGSFLTVSAAELAIRTIEGLTPYGN